MIKKEERKGFGDLLVESWKEYKDNFKTILIIFLILSAVPALLYTFFSFSVNVPQQATQAEMLSFYSSTEGILYLFFGLIVTVIGLWMSISIIYLGFNLQKKLKAGELMIKAGKYLFKYILLWLLIYLILFVLSIPMLVALGFGVQQSSTGEVVMNPILLSLAVVALILPLIFLIYFAFAYLILIGENEKITQSIKKSKELVKGNWWKVVFYGLLLVIMLILITIVISIPGVIINTYSGYSYSVTDALGNPIKMFSNTGIIINQIFGLVASLITAPLALLFMKNFYLELKRQKEKQQKPEGKTENKKQKK